MTSGFQGYAEMQPSAHVGPSVHVGPSAIGGQQTQEPNYTHVTHQSVNSASPEKMHHHDTSAGVHRSSTGQSQTRQGKVLACIAATCTKHATVLLLHCRPIASGV